MSGMSMPEKPTRYRNSYMIAYLIIMFQTYFIIYLAISTPIGSAMKEIALVIIEIFATLLFKTLFCNQLTCSRPACFGKVLTFIVLEYPHIIAYYRLVFEMVELRSQLQIYKLNHMVMLFFLVRYIFATYQIIYLNITRLEQTYLILCYAVISVLEIRTVIPDGFFCMLYFATLLATPFVSLIIIDITKHPNANIELHVSNLNRMALILKTAFVNSLPKRLIPLIIRNQKLPCEIAQGITTVYIHIKNDDSLLSNPESHQAKLMISKINFLLCIFDFLAETTCIQKIKSSYSYYMACSGAKTHFTGDGNNEVTDQKQQFHLLATFCMACQEAARLMDITISAGITSGNAVVGVIGLEDSNVNLDIYGDTINLGARIARTAESGIFFALRDNSICKYYKVNQIQSSSAEFDFRNFQDLLAACDYEDVKASILSTKPGYYFGNKFVKNYKGKGDKQIIELIQTEYFAEDFQVILQNALQKLFDYTQVQNDQDNVNFSSFLRQIDLFKRKSEIKIQSRESDIRTNSVEKCIAPIHCGLLISQTSQLIVELKSTHHIVLSYNKKLAAQEQKIIYDKIKFGTQNPSGILIKESLSQQLFSRMYQFGGEQQNSAQKLRDNLIDEAIDSEDENESPAKYQPKWQQAEFSASNSANKYDPMPEQHNSSSSIVDNMLKPKLASFLEIARNTNDIRKGNHSSSGQGRQSTTSRQSNSQMASQHQDGDNELQLRHSDEKSENFAQNCFTQVKLMKGLNGLSHIAKAVRQQESELKQRLNRQMDELYNQAPTDHALVPMCLYKVRQFIFLSTYCEKQLTDEPQYYQQFICYQKPRASVCILVFYLAYQVAFLLIKCFKRLPELNFYIFGFSFNARRFRTINLWFLTLNALLYILSFREFFARQRVFQQRPRKQNATELLESCGQCLRFCYQLFIALQVVLHTSREVMYYDIYNQYRSQQVFDYFVPLLFLCIALEVAAYVSVMSLLLSHYVAPVLFLSQGIFAFVTAVFISTIFILIRRSNFCFIQLAQNFFILAFVLPNLRQHIFLTQLNFKLSQQINNGRELLKLILPTITIDSLLASSTPNDLQSMISQFPFLSSYKDSIIQLYDFEDVLSLEPECCRSADGCCASASCEDAGCEISTACASTALSGPKSADQHDSSDQFHASAQLKHSAGACYKGGKTSQEGDYCASGQQNMPDQPSVPCGSCSACKAGKPCCAALKKSRTAPTGLLIRGLQHALQQLSPHVFCATATAQDSQNKRGQPFEFEYRSQQDQQTFHSQGQQGSCAANLSSSANKSDSTNQSDHSSQSKQPTANTRISAVCSPQNNLQELYCGFLLFPNPLTFSQRRPLINFKNAAYLNLDIANFTEFSSQITVEQTLAFLTTLYQMFDRRIRQAHNLIQIKISGDSYELMSLPCTLKRYEDSGRISDEFQFKNAQLQKIFKTSLSLRSAYDAAVCLIAVGLGFIDDCKAVLHRQFPDIKIHVALRVGIAFGAVAGALLGDRLCRFDVFGSVPKEAERCQESARQNSVCISKCVRDILKEGERAFKEYIDRLQAQEEAGGQRTLKLSDEIVQFEEQDGCIVGIK